MILFVFLPFFISFFTIILMEYSFLTLFCYLFSFFNRISSSCFFLSTYGGFFLYNHVMSIVSNGMFMSRKKIRRRGLAPATLAAASAAAATVKRRINIFIDAILHQENIQVLAFSFLLYSICLFPLLFPREFETGK